MAAALIIQGFGKVDPPGFSSSINLNFQARFCFLICRSRIIEPSRVSCDFELEHEDSTLYPVMNNYV